MFFLISKIRWRNQFHSMILFKGYCGWKQIQRGPCIQVSQCLWSFFFNLGLSGCRAQLGYSASPGEKQNKYLYQRNSFRAFLNNIKAKTAQATLLKSAFWNKDYFPLHFCVCRTLNWEDSGPRILHSSKCWSHKTEKNMVSPGVRSSKN